jgi:hypothetical protein
MSYAMPGLPTATSNSRQSGSLYYVTVDANGNLGYVTTPIGGASASITPELAPASIGVAMGEAPATVAEPVEAGTSLAVNSSRGSRQTSSDIPAAPSRAALAALSPSAVSDQQFSALSDRVGSLEGRVDTLFDLVAQDRRQTRGGIAAAMAMGGTMIVPDSAVSMNFNLATYRGEQGFSGIVVARVAPKVYVSGGFSGSTVSKSTGGRVGVALGF